jgi:hypothetical protein
MERQLHPLFCTRDAYPGVLRAWTTGIVCLALAVVDVHISLNASFSPTAQFVSICVIRGQTLFNVIRGQTICG